MPKKPNVAKVSTPRGNATSMTPVSPYQVAVNVQYGQSRGIVQNTGADWFGPLNPMAPIAPPEVIGRQFDYIPGANLVTTPRSGDTVGFPMMRMLADSYDLLRLVIETRKDQVCKLKWKVRVKEDAKEKPKGPAKKKAEVEVKPDQQTAIDEITALLRRPDGFNRWRPWLRSLLEDMFVIDAPSLYCQRNRGGKLIALKPVDGGTIKVIIDDWGRTPTEPIAGGTSLPPAYQQVLKGFPAVNYTVRDMIYRPYNKRVHKVYGYSPVEQIIMTVNIAMRRQAFQLAYYTEGNIPEALIGTPDGWTPEQVGAFQKMWDQMFTGNLAQRRHAKFVPGGVAKTYIPTKEPDLKNPMDEWLARVVCFAFSVSPQAFVAMMNRATAGTAADTAKEEGIEPLKEWVAEVINDVIENEFDRDDMEFAFDEEVEVDQEKQQTIITGYVDSGLKTINQGREMMGDEPDPNPAANVLMVKTGTGYVPIDASTAEGKRAMIDAGLAPDPTALPAFGANPDDPESGGKPPPGKRPAFGGAKPASDAPPQDPKGPAAKPKPAEKHVHAHVTGAFSKAARRARRLASIPFDRPATGAAVRTITRLVYGALQEVAADAARHVRAELSKAVKAKETNDEKARRIARGVDLSAIEEIIPDVADALGATAKDAAGRALAQIGPDDEKGLVDVVNTRAVEQARQKAAELVGMRYDKDGNLVPSRNAEYRIDDTTRDMIRGIIADGLDENIGTDEIADNIEESTGFSRERAELIANTEVRRANSDAALDGYREARDGAGVDVKKEWLLGDNPCDVCEANAAQGAIDLDETFESGDDAPPAHPNCECAVAPVVVEPESSSSDDE